MVWVKLIIFVLLITALSVFLFTLIRTHILSRYKVKKLYPLLIMILLLLLPIPFNKIFSNPIIQGVQLLFVSLCLLTYMEISTIEKNEKNKPIVGRPKKKPNKIKNIDAADDVNSGKKSKWSFKKLVRK